MTPNIKFWSEKGSVCVNIVDIKNFMFSENKEERKRIMKTKCRYKVLVIFEKITIILKF